MVEDNSSQQLKDALASSEKMKQELENMDLKLKKMEEELNSFKEQHAKVALQKLMKPPSRKPSQLVNKVLRAKMDKVKNKPSSEGTSKTEEASSVQPNGNAGMNSDWSQIPDLRSQLGRPLFEPGEAQKINQVLSIMDRKKMLSSTTFDRLRRSNLGALMKVQFDKHRWTLPSLTKTLTRSDGRRSRVS